MFGSGSSSVFPIQRGFTKSATVKVNNNIFFFTVVTNIVEADIVGIIVDTTTSTVYCNLLSSYIYTTDAVCSITYGYPQGNCDQYTDSSVTTTGQPGVNLTIHLSQNVNIGAEFCYTISLKYGITRISIVGNFTSGNNALYRQDTKTLLSIMLVGMASNINISTYISVWIAQNTKEPRLNLHTDRILAHTFSQCILDSYLSTNLDLK